MGECLSVVVVFLAFVSQQLYLAQSSNHSQNSCADILQISSETGSWEDKVPSLTELIYFCLIHKVCVWGRCFQQSELRTRGQFSVKVKLVFCKRMGI